MEATGTRGCGSCTTDTSHVDGAEICAATGRSSTSPRDIWASCAAPPPTTTTFQTITSCISLPPSSVDEIISFYSQITLSQTALYSPHCPSVFRPKCLFRREEDQRTFNTSQLPVKRRAYLQKRIRIARNIRLRRQIQENHERSTSFQLE